MTISIRVNTVEEQERWMRVFTGISASDAPIGGAVTYSAWHVVPRAMSLADWAFLMLALEHVRAETSEWRNAHANAFAASGIAFSGAVADAFPSCYTNWPVRRLDSPVLAVIPPRKRERYDVVLPFKLPA